MSENLIRIGLVSSVNYSDGTIKVVYPDKDDAVSDDLPVLNFGGFYAMPKIDDAVLVAHLSNGSSMGIVCGAFWSEGNKPRESGKGLFRLDLSDDGSAYIKAQNGVITIHGRDVITEKG